MIDKPIEEKGSFTEKLESARARLPTFFALTFLISLPIWILAVLTIHMIPEGLPINHIGFLAVIAPITAAFILAYKENGFDAAKKLLKRSFDYKRITRKVWYVPIFFLLPIIYTSSLGLMILIGVQFPGNPFPVVAAPILFLLLIIFALCEEVGWQGYAFGPMEKRWNTLNASIALGIIWAIWHIPMYVLQNPPGGLIWIAGQCVNVVVTRILIVWIFNNTGKSVFATILFHAVLNLCTMLLPIYGSPLGPTVASVFTILTAVIVISLAPHTFQLQSTRRDGR